ncbi:SGNH/GDSL hydrolase family protein [Pedobacter insulae]|uniref:Lysophospholipase L1 n=1 Tax=Pedobacter insulae TaxID=414048 RepID=A0A1I2T9R0_9SPHI|nr:GDSL-type esterase/lipase family protein [Pedobacter insulae]SFG60819.1 Lysophospholipase L1 [Pedobacter insulae]
MKPKITDSSALTYLALGDSYTIGEAVSQSESFPYQVAAQLKLQGMNVASPKIIAKTGWTTDELQAAIKAEELTEKFDIVTLLIGVNNQYRGYSKDTYRKEFKELLQTAINFAGGNVNKVFVISIPDWGVTPFGKGSGRDTKLIAEEIDAYNVINKEETLALKVSYTDITPGSRKAATDLSLVATDGLHYSGKMHLQWALSLPLTLR